MSRSGGERGRGAVVFSMILLGAILGSVLAACSGPILANPPAPRATPPSPTPAGMARKRASARGSKRGCTSSAGRFVRINRTPQLMS